MKPTITTVELSLAIVNKDLATFNVNGAISGVVNLPTSGPVTVVLDGGYVLGEFHCPACHAICECCRSAELLWHVLLRP